MISRSRTKPHYYAEASSAVLVGTLMLASFNHGQILHAIDRKSLHPLIKPSGRYSPFCLQCPLKKHRTVIPRGQLG